MSNVTIMLRRHNRLLSTFARQYSSRSQKLTNSDVSKKRNELFGREKARQTANVSRVEKIQVEYRGPPEQCTLLMNKNLSTPFNCTMHIQELLMTRSVMALVNGRPWDMHKPLEEDCEISFLHFKDEDPSLANEALWRTGSFLMGYVLENSLKDDFYVELCSFPPPNIQSGSFVYDADLKMHQWQPTSMELQSMSRTASRLAFEDTKFEQMDVDASVALSIFEDNRFKSAQIPVIASKSPVNKVSVYRMGTHIDMSRGPLIANTNLISRFNVCGIHDISTDDYGPLKRIQGLIMPKQLPVHYWTYEYLMERAAKLNQAPHPKLDSPKKLAAENGS